MSDISLRQALKELRILERRLKQQRSTNITVKYLNDTPDSYFHYDGKATFAEMKQSSYITIGIKDLRESAHCIRLFPVSDVYFVRAVASLYHEFEHYDQHVYRYADPNASDFAKQEARSMIIANAAGTAYYDRYYTDFPYEQEAFLKSALRAKAYFDKNHPEIHAGEIIAMDYSGTKICQIPKTNDFNKVVSHMAVQLPKVPYRMRTFDFDHPSNELRALADDKSLRKAYAKAQNGVEADQILIDGMRFFNLDYLRACSCLKNDSLRWYVGQNQYQSERGKDAGDKFADIINNDETDQDKDFGE